MSVPAVSSTFIRYVYSGSNPSAEIFAELLAGAAPVLVILSEFLLLLIVIRAVRSLPPLLITYMSTAVTFVTQKYTVFVSELFLMPSPSQAVAATVSSVSGLIVYFLPVTALKVARLPDFPPTTHPALYHVVAFEGVVHNKVVSVKDFAVKLEIEGSEGLAAHALPIPSSTSVNRVSSFFICFCF